MSVPAVIGCYARNRGNVACFARMARFRARLFSSKMARVVPNKLFNAMAPPPAGPRVNAGVGPTREIAMATDRLETVKAYAMIFASVAVPILIAVFGWLAQTGASERGANKEYVQMALAILEDGESSPELRGWAASVMDNLSPVPLSGSLRRKLSSGDLALPQLRERIPEQFLAPPQEWREVEEKATYRDVMLNYVDNRLRFHENAIQMQFLQELITGSPHRNAGEDSAVPAQQAVHGLLPQAAGEVNR